MVLSSKMSADEAGAGAAHGRLPEARGRHWLFPAALALTAAVNTLWVVYSTLYAPGLVVREGGLTISVNPDTELRFMKTRIAAALVVCVAGLIYRGARGVGISTLALLWVVGEYATWWLKSFFVVYSSESQSFSKVEHTALLHDAGWWDIWVLVVVIATLAWKVKTRQVFRPPSGR